MCSRQEDCQPSIGICEAETISSESGTIYSWPETREGEVATFACPLNARVNVTRSCSVGGVWESFNEEACGVVNEQFNRLNNLFDNVRQLICKVNLP